jgi:hypothetical protein
VPSSRSTSRELWRVRRSPTNALEVEEATAPKVRRCGAPGCCLWQDALQQCPPEDDCLLFAYAITRPVSGGKCFGKKS